MESKDTQDMPLNTYGIREPASDKTLNGFDGSVDLVITPGVALIGLKIGLGTAKVITTRGSPSSLLDRHSLASGSKSN